MNDPQLEHAAPDVEVFTGAFPLSIPERAEYLRAACGDDERLRRRVEALLRAHDEAGAFLSGSTPGFQAEARFGGVAAEKPGDQIGRYELREQLGEGGCGVVFLAEQHTPVRRLVALKVIKPGMDTRQVLARFEAERQALAMMDHPNIAKVLDAGATDIGRPYFVMELVRGTKVTDFCNEQALSVPARLTLFLEICHAVQHAHQKGIIHRDLKPSNVLVTSDEDGTPVPKVIDFGIAKATTGDPLTDKTMFTAVEMLIGTPAYMSPEQANQGAVDTRTDIYSLGVLLYELLTGATPFEGRESWKAGLDELRRVIAREEPVRPSARLRALPAPELAVIAGQRQTEGAHLIRAIRGDLDWIVVMTLQKDPARRYDTANGLAADVRRYLQNEVITARPPSGWYRFQKLAARNKVAFAAITVIGILLIAGLAIVSLSLRKEQASRREADAARAQAVLDKYHAESETAKSRQVTRFLEEMLNGVGPSAARGRDTALLEEILEKTSERTGRDLNGQPAVQIELWNTVGGVLFELSLYARAEPLLRLALERQRQLDGRETPATARAKVTLARTLGGMGRTNDAEALTREALAFYRQRPGNEGPEVSAALNMLGYLLTKQGKYAEAETTHREALAMRRRLGAEPLDVAQSLGNLSVTLSNEKKKPEAESVLREALGIWKKQLGNEDLTVTRSMANLGMLLQDQGNLAESEKIQWDALASFRRQLPEWHENVTTAVSQLTLLLVLQNRRSQATPLLEVLRQMDFRRYPQALTQLAARGERLATLGLWPEAAADAARRVELEPAEHQAYHAYAPLLVALDQRERYESLCRVILKRFGDAPADLYVADRMAKDCLILPVPGLALEKVQALTDYAVTHGRENGAYPLFCSCKALAEYRLKDYPEAIDWSKKALKSSFPYSSAQAYFVLAMSQHAWGNEKEARMNFDKMTTVVKDKMPQVEDRNLDRDWRDWIIVHALMKEARQELEPQLRAP